MKTLGNLVHSHFPTFKSIAFVLLFTYSFLLPLCAQVVINEVQPTGVIELKNVGTTTVDVSNYWLCQFPSYSVLSSLRLQCGDLLMQPGEITTISNFNFVNNPAEGEVGLYSTRAFSSAAAILDYVEWGTPGGGRSNVAVSAGIWTAGTAVPSFSTGSSISYKGSGNSATDWVTTSSPSICAENVFTPTCNVSGGNIDTYSSTTLCSSQASIVEFTVSDAVGTSRTWLVADEQGTILATQQTGNFNFSAFQSGKYTVYFLSWDSNNFGGIAIGGNLSNLVGCFDLSNGVVVTVVTVNGGTITTNDLTTICVGDSAVRDSISFSVTGSNGPSRTWLMTDAQGTILTIQRPRIFGFSELGAGNYTVLFIAFDPNNISGLEVGANIANLSGCFDLSNGVVVTVVTVNGGTITTNDLTTICVGDSAVRDSISFSVTGSNGPSRTWLMTDAQGTILTIQRPRIFGFSELGAGNYTVLFIAFDPNNISGLEVGANIANLSGCFDLSNGIVVSIVYVNGGTISTSDLTTLCLSDSTIPDSITFSVSGSVGTSRTWLMTDDQGVIKTIQRARVFDFGNVDAGLYAVYFISWDTTNFSGLEVGANIVDLLGCFHLSNGIEVIVYDKFYCQARQYVDLELTISTRARTYNIYQQVPYQIVISNKGTQSSTGVVVDAPIPAGMVYTSSNTTNGQYKIFERKWYIPEIVAGGSDTLNLTVFTLVGNQIITNFVQVLAANEEDIDSTPNNNNGEEGPAEDDEDSIIIVPLLSNNTGTSTSENLVQIYPSPAIDEITVAWNNTSNSKSIVNIVNTNGIVVKTLTFTDVSAHEQHIISVADLASGAYFVQIINEKETYLLPFLKTQ